MGTEIIKIGSPGKGLSSTNCWPRFSGQVTPHLKLWLPQTISLSFQGYKQMSLCSVTDRLCQPMLGLLSLGLEEAG